MKKAIFLLPLATLAMAGTTGSVRAHTEFWYSNSMKNNGSQVMTTKENEFKLMEALIGTEIKVKGTGFSLGAELAKNEVKFPIDNSATKTPSKAKLHIKYDLLEMNKVNSYVRLGINHDEILEKPLRVELQGDISLKINDKLNFGYNNLTEIPLYLPPKQTTQVDVSTTSQQPQELRDLVETTHRIYLKDNKDKINAYAEVNHNYGKTNSLKYLALHVNKTYDKIKDLKIKGQFDFKYAFNTTFAQYSYSALGNKKLDFYPEIFNKNFKEENGKYKHSYEIDVNYKNFNAGLFVQHLNVQNNTYTTTYGLELGVAPKINNFTFTAKGLVFGTHTIDVSSLTTRSTNDNSGVTNDADAMLKFGGKYDIKPTDKFTISPEFNVITSFRSLISNPATEVGLIPSIEMKYMPTKNFEINSKAISFVSFEGAKYATPTYHDAKLGMILGVKYTW